MLRNHTRAVGTALAASFFALSLPLFASAAFWPGFPFAPAPSGTVLELPGPVPFNLCVKTIQVGRMKVQVPQPCHESPPPPPAEPTLTFTANPTTVEEGNSSTLTWDSTNATSCTASGGWSGSKSVDGSQAVSPTVTTNYVLTCTGAGGNVIKDVTVTVTAAPEDATLTLVKTVTNNNGGNASASNFQAKIDGNNVAWNVAHVVTVGSHTASETSVAGYSASVWGGDCAADGTVTLAAGEDKTCTITNDDQAGTLRVVKVVTNDNNGSNTADDFSFQVNGGTVTAFEADGQNDIPVNAGTYSVAETAATGYTTTYNNCSNVDVSNGETETCTITNNDVVPDSPIIDFTATRDTVHEGSASEATSTLEWTTTNAASCTASNGWSGSKPVNGTQEVQPTGVTSITYVLECTGLGGTDTESVTITVVPPVALLPGHLIVDKVTQPGGDSTEFTISASGSGAITGGGAGIVTDATNKDYEVAAGTYSVTETVPTGWTQVSNTCTGVVVDAGETETCTITNAKVPTLTFSAIPTTVNEGSVSDATTTLTWDSTNATSCAASGATEWTGAKSVDGSEVVTPTADVTYELDCSGVGGTVHQEVTIDFVPEVPEAGALLITEVLYDVGAEQTEGDNEWVEIHNGTNAQIDLSGYFIQDNGGFDYIPDGTVLAAGGFLLITGSSTTANLPGGVTTIILADNDLGNGLANGGDRMGLFTAASSSVDMVSWGGDVTAFTPSVFPTTSDDNPGSTVARTPATTDTNTAADWVEDETPTPGVTN